MKKRDWIFVSFVIIIVAILAAINIFARKNGDTAEVYVNSRLVMSLPLNENTTRDINGGSNRIRIENGYAYMEYADCPDKLCVKQGKISDNSHDIVCLPNGVTVRITKKSEIDAVSR